MSTIEQRIAKLDSGNSALGIAFNRGTRHDVRPVLPIQVQPFADLIGQPLRTVSGGQVHRLHSRCGGLLEPA